jgi:TetR/AcrR family transcriptional repressor of lmrAB and yxaGH operons
MSAPPKHRGAIIRAAATLFRRNGFSGTGLNEIVAVSGAPKGSLYHYFPNGKDQIAEAAVRFAGALVTATFEKLYQANPSASALVRSYGKLLAGWMTQSEFRDGCPIATTLLEAAPSSAAVTAAGCEIFEGWSGVIRRALARDGFGKTEARKLSALTIAGFEGALILARVQRSDRAILDVADALAGALRARTRNRKRASG